MWQLLAHGAASGGTRIAWDEILLFVALIGVLFGVLYWLGGRKGGSAGAPRARTRPASAKGARRRRS